MWANARRLPEEDTWLKLLAESGDFLVATRRHQGLFPRSWYPDGRAVGWDGDEPARGSITASGAYLVAPLAKLHQLTGDARYLSTAESALAAYYARYGQDLRNPYWGATLDAGSEDRESGWGVLHGALALYEASRKPHYLEWARDAGDWLLTWYYMYDVQLPEGAPAHGFLNTVGWTSISVQYPQIDGWGAFMAPDFHRLGTYLNDRRYHAVSRTLFEATTQTIARPGAMLGLKAAGSQPEHCNQTNATHIPGAAWRGTCSVADISWVHAAILYNGARMAEIGAISW
jgi:hypothetical protein